MAQQIAHEEIVNNGVPVLINGKKITVAEGILRKWANDPTKQVHFLEVAFGKVPVVNEITGKGGEEIIFRVVRD